jgi:hypothetical protein
MARTVNHPSRRRGPSATTRGEAMAAAVTLGLLEDR